MDYDNFLFYGTFMKTAESLPMDIRNEFVWAILQFGTKGTFESENQIVNAIMYSIIPTIEKSKTNYKKSVEVGKSNGQKGGRPKEVNDLFVRELLTSSDLTLQEVSDRCGCGLSTVKAIKRAMRSESQKGSETLEKEKDKEKEKEKDMDKDKDKEKDKNMDIDMDTKKRIIDLFHAGRKYNATDHEIQDDIGINIRPSVIRTIIDDYNSGRLSFDSCTHTHDTHANDFTWTHDNQTYSISKSEIDDGYTKPNYKLDYDSLIKQGADPKLLSDWFFKMFDVTIDNDLQQ